MRSDVVFGHLAEGPGGQPLGALSGFFDPSNVERVATLVLQNAPHGVGFLGSSLRRHRRPWPKACAARLAAVHVPVLPCRTVRAALVDDHVEPSFDPNPEGPGLPGAGLLDK